MILPVWYDSLSRLHPHWFFYLMKVCCKMKVKTLVFLLFCIVFLKMSYQIESRLKTIKTKSK